MFMGYGDESASYYPFTVYVENAENLSSGYWVQLTITSEATEEMNMGNDCYLWKPFILEENGKMYVYKRGEDDLLHKTEIVTGKINNGCYKIISGITQEDWIAFPYGKEVKEGAKTREGTIDDIYV